MGDGAELDKTPTKFRILRGTPRREAKISLLKNIPAPKLDKTRPKMDALKKVLVGKTAERGVFGLKRLIPPLYCWCTGQFVVAIVIAPEYKPAAGACRSPGARKEPSAVSDQPSAKKKGTAEGAEEISATN